MTPSRLLFAILIVLVLSPWGLVIYTSIESNKILERTEADMITLRQSASATRASLEEVTSERDQLRQDMANLMVIKDSLESHEESLLEELNSLREQIADREDERASFRNRIEAATQETMSALRRADETARLLSQFERDTERVTERLNQLEARNEQLEADNTRLSTIIRRLGLNPDASTQSVAPAGSQNRQTPPPPPQQTRPAEEPPRNPDNPRWSIFQ